MKYKIIGSSSSGNCIIVEDKIMLDCGVSYAKVKLYLNKIKIIFISHIHEDHLLPSSIKKIAYNYPNIKYICGSTDIVNVLVNKCNVNKKNIYYLKENKKYDLGMFKCKLEPVYHDVPNHLIKIEMKDKKILYVVDTASLENIEAKNYDLYFVEANYDEELLKQHIEEIDETGEFDYLHRVKYTHLSKQQALNFLVENMGDNSEYCFIHKSEYNFEENN